MPLIDLALLQAHPANANVMPEPLFAKLAAHIEATGCYPPIIVRPISLSLVGRGRGGGSNAAGECEQSTPTPTLPLNGEGVRYQILDGHHRARVLNMLGCAQARCDVWEVDDEQANMLLLTLNRLHGEDDPRKRGELLSRLRESMHLDELAAKLPDDLSRIEKLISLTKPPQSAIAQPKALDDMPHAVTFFLTGAQRRVLFGKLKEHASDRSEALVWALGLDQEDAKPQAAEEAR